MVNIGNSWDERLKDQFSSEYYLNLRQFLKKEYATTTVFPPMFDIFNALKATDYDDVKVVILGQDPYPTIGHAHGLCFSVKRGVHPPRSLRNIYEEQYHDLDIVQPKFFGELTEWTNQGVLLLNTVLTVRENKPNSHKGMGWEILTDHIISLLNERDKPIVFMLWGANAKAKKALITNNNHLILEAAHPSPMSADKGFFGCRHFSQANAFLKANGMDEIDWQLHE